MKWRGIAGIIAWPFMWWDGETPRLRRWTRPLVWLMYGNDP